MVEVIDAAGTCSEPMGIDAAAETRAAADDAAERKLRRLVRAGAQR
ncbi:MAG TPA: hypothetical protein VG222_16445 [Vicinamibacterales bacterium]|nr:hypothetical protein [Vicinamibacterales bacterium]